METRRKALIVFLLFLAAALPPEGGSYELAAGVTAASQVPLPDEEAFFNEPIDLL